MFHLHKHIGISFRHQWLFSVTRFATTAASAPSADPAPFAVEDYLVASCHLTRDKARKASNALSHLKSPSNPDAVLAFLSGPGLGLSPLDIATAVARDPPLLLCKVDSTLAPRLAKLRDFGLSPSQIAEILLIAPRCYASAVPTSSRSSSTTSPSSAPFMTSFVRSGKSSYLLPGVNLESVVKPNVSCLRQWSLSAHEISKTCINQPSLLVIKQEDVRAILARAEDIGIPRGNPMFRHALLYVAGRDKEVISYKMELLKKTFRWSDAEVASVVSRNPSVLTVSEDMARRVSELLISEVGLDPEYIARRPALIKFSLEGRLMPRHYVLKFLKVNGLLRRDRDYYSAVNCTEKVFVEKFINPYREAAPHLAEGYADACRGKMPSRFSLQEPGTGLASV